MNAFSLRDRIIQDYAAYVQSFLKIRDGSTRQFVHQKLAEGALWPEALVQLNPAYEFGPTAEDLVAGGHLHPMCGQIFRVRAPDDDSLRSIRLYRHQHEAIRAALRREHYVLTTGTGSGKSLTYLIPIFDHILKHNPEQGRVRAIIVYPLNALINSQEKAIRAFGENMPGEMPIRVNRYTGQENDEEKQAIRENPPHVLLTNYVMLELMLTRPAERPFVDRTLAALEFLVLDELHTYRGRQGGT